MDRRALLATASTALASTAAARPAARPDLLRRPFEALGASRRRTVQTELQIAGLYGHRVDGRYGPATERAPIPGARHLRENSGGRIAADLATPRGVASDIEGLATLRYSSHLYGEGDECDPPGSCGD